MKIFQIATATFIIAVGIFTACQNDNSASQSTTPAGSESSALPSNLPEGQGLMSQDGGAQTVVTVPPTDQAALAEPAQNAAGTWHYTCPKGCEGGAGSAIACAKCGTMLTHNSKYHPKTEGEGAKAAPAPTQAAPAQKAEPAQNAAGVWHYTCPGGCAGGAGSAVACAKCGKTLTHNGAYHN